MNLSRIVLVLCLSLYAMAVNAEELGPAIVYSTGGKFDRSFNEAAYNGAETFKSETGTAYREFELERDAQSEQAIRNFATRGHSPIVVIGFNQASALEKVAPDFPETKFSIVDMVVDQPNVRSVVFKEHEGSYLAGLLAAMASKTGTIGFVGGMDIPLIRKFACGYRQGAKAAKPATEVLTAMAGTTVAAFADPARGAEIAKDQIARGADVVIQAAGGTGVGVLQATADAGKLGIGTDSNQNGLHPGNMLTSIRKRVDIAVYSNFMDAKNSKWVPGVQVLGLAEGGMDWVIDGDNKSLITEDMKAAADMATAGIVAGNIVVHDYTTDGSCPIE